MRILHVMSHPVPQSTLNIISSFFLSSSASTTVSRDFVVKDDGYSKIKKENENRENEEENQSSTI